MLIGTKECAKLMKISPRRVRALLAQQRIEGAYKVGRMWLIPTRDGRPIVRESDSGAKTRWAKLVRRPRQKDLTVIKVVRDNIGYNRKNKANIPVISVKKASKCPVHVHEIEINGPSKLCYSLVPRKDKGNAVVWLETHFGVELFLNDDLTGNRSSIGFV